MVGRINRMREEGHTILNRPEQPFSFVGIVFVVSGVEVDVPSFTSSGHTPSISSTTNIITTFPLHNERLITAHKNLK